MERYGVLVVKLPEDLSVEELYADIMEHTGCPREEIWIADVETDQDAHGAVALALDMPLLHQVNA